MKKAAGFVTAVLVATPAWAITQQTKGVVQVAGIMSAAEKWCKEYTIDLGKVRQGMRSNRINMNDPEVKQVFVQAYSQFEAGLLAQGETKMCGAIYAQTRQSAQRGLGVLMIRK